MAGSVCQCGLQFLTGLRKTGRGFSVRDDFFDYRKSFALLFNLQMDPFEEHGGTKSQEMAMRLGIAWSGQVKDAMPQDTFKEFPPRQKGGTLRPGGS